MIYYILNSCSLWLTAEKLRREDYMKIYYDKLWRLLKDNKMQKKDLASAAELSSYTMTKLNQNRPVSMDVILRLCKIFHCGLAAVLLEW